MAVNNSQTCVTLEAGANLSTKQYLFVSIASDGQVDPTGDGLSAVGVLQNDPAAAGRAAEVCIGGLTKVKTGGQVAAGAAVASDANGAAVTAGTGDVILGTAVDGGASGSIISIIFQPR
jgi:hypothetical protein